MMKATLVLALMAIPAFVVGGTVQDQLRTKDGVMFNVKLSELVPGPPDIKVNTPMECMNRCLKVLLHYPKLGIQIRKLINLIDRMITANSLDMVH